MFSSKELEFIKMCIEHASKDKQLMVGINSAKADVMSSKLDILIKTSGRTPAIFK